MNLGDPAARAAAGPQEAGGREFRRPGVIAEANPTASQYRVHLADIHVDLADLLARTGRPKQAEPGYRTALAIYGELADWNPSTAAYRRRRGRHPLRLASATRPARARPAGRGPATASERATAIREALVRCFRVREALQPPGRRPRHTAAQRGSPGAPRPWALAWPTPGRSAGALRRADVTVGRGARPTSLPPCAVQPAWPDGRARASRPPRPPKADAAMANLRKAVDMATATSLIAARVTFPDSPPLA